MRIRRARRIEILGIVVLMLLSACRSRPDVRRANILGEFENDSGPPRSAEERTAVAWILAAALGDVETFEPLTALPFMFRSAPPDSVLSAAIDTGCEAPVATRAAASRWLACIGNRRDLRNLRNMLGVGGGWIRIESRRTDAYRHEHLDTLARELGRDSPWLHVQVSWLYTLYRFRLLLDGGASLGPRVKAAILELTEVSD
jgi:hypothetical protein